jgi:hypothetical protein
MQPPVVDEANVDVGCCCVVRLSQIPHVSRTTGKIAVVLHVLGFLIGHVPFFIVNSGPNQPFRRALESRFVANALDSQVRRALSHTYSHDDGGTCNAFNAFSCYQEWERPNCVIQGNEAWEGGYLVRSQQWHCNQACWNTDRSYYCSNCTAELVGDGGCYPCEPPRRCGRDEVPQTDQSPSLAWLLFVVLPTVAFWLLGVIGALLLIPAVGDKCCGACCGAHSTALEGRLNCVGVLTIIASTCHGVISLVELFLFWIQNVWGGSDVYVLLLLLKNALCFGSEIACAAIACGAKSALAEQRRRAWAQGQPGMMMTTSHAPQLAVGVPAQLATMPAAVPMQPVPVGQPVVVGSTAPHQA